MSGNGGGGGGYGPPTGAPYGPPYGPPPGQGAPGPGPIPPQGYPYGPPPPVPPGPYAPPEPPPLLPPVEPSRAQKILRGVRNPFYAAQRAFRPSRAGLAEDASVRRLQLWRTGLGLAAYIGLTATYRAVADVEGVKAMAEDEPRFNQSWSSVLVLVCHLPLVVGAFIAAARGDLRRTYLRRTPAPARRGGGRHRIDGHLPPRDGPGDRRIPRRGGRGGDGRPRGALPVVPRLRLYGIGLSSSTSSAPPTSTRFSRRSSPGSWSGRWPSSTS
ncbi:hypothetical protein GCM10020229_54910 [Kitasatospora albolonga]